MIDDRQAKSLEETVTLRHDTRVSFVAGAGVPAGRGEEHQGPDDHAADQAGVTAFLEGGVARAKGSGAAAPAGSADGPTETLHGEFAKLAAVHDKLRAANPSARQLWEQVKKLLG